MFFQEEENKIYSFWGDMTNEEDDDTEYGSEEDGEDLDIEEDFGEGSEEVEEKEAEEEDSNDHDDDI